MEAAAPDGSDWDLVLDHRAVPVVTYPHEWSFSMLQDAARLTLRLVREAKGEGFTTKDATPYNVQFVGPEPTFIDIGSFEPYRAGEPWWGYRQFCQMFLYPLMFTAYKDLPHQPWMRGAVDGITPEQARRVLQGRRHGRKGLTTHVWLHAKADKRFSGGSAATVEGLKQAGYNKKIYINMVDRLCKLVDGLRRPPGGSAWAGYSERSHYMSEAASAKAQFVRRVAAQRHRAAQGQQAGRHPRRLHPRCHRVTGRTALRCSPARGAGGRHPGAVPPRPTRLIRAPVRRSGRERRRVEGLSRPAWR